MRQSSSKGQRKSNKGGSTFQQSVFSDKNQQPLQNCVKSLVNSRMLDNHFLIPIHKKSWNATVKQLEATYNYDDSGLAFTLKDRTETELQSEKDCVKEKMKQGFRNFRELEDIKGCEVAVTIEYCTNCHQHRETTRHDQGKYLDTALELKKQILKNFPIVKVYLKPLIIDMAEHSTDNLYLRKRIGCFEIQIIAGSELSSGAQTIKGGQTVFHNQNKKGVLFSKLKTGSWPQINKILTEIRNYMRKVNLEIVLDLSGFNISNVNQDSMTNTIENKLYDIPVYLRPYRLKQMLEQQQALVSRPPSGVPYDTDRSFGKISHSQYSATGNTRINSAMRPKSAYSQVSGHSLLSNSKFGGGASSFTNFNPNDNSQGEIVKGKTTKDGTVLFTGLPQDVYELIIMESNDHKAYAKKIDIFEKFKQQEQFDLFEQVQLSHHNKCYLKINCSYKNYDQESDEGLLKGATIQMISTSEEGNEQNDQNAITDTFNGVWETNVTPGYYRIIITKPGHTSIDEQYLADFGERVKKFDSVTKLYQEEESKTKEPSIKPQKSPSSTTGILKTPNTTKSTTSQQPPNPGTIQPEPPQQPPQQPQYYPSIPQKKPQSPDAVRPVSASKNMKMTVLDVIENKPIEGVSIDIKDKVAQRPKEDIKTNNQGVASISMINMAEGVIEISHPKYFLVTEKYGREKPKDATYHLFPRPKNDNDFQLYCISANQESILDFTEQAEDDIDVEDDYLGKISIKIKNIKKKSGIIRIFASIDDPDKLTPNNVKIHLVYRDQYKTIIPPSANADEKKKPKYWDIGFITSNEPGQFVEINGLCQNKPDKEYLIKEYQLLLNYLGDSSIQLVQILGFNDQQRVQKDDDVCIRISKIISYLDKYSFSEAQNIRHLLHSAICEDGKLYSFNKLKAKFSSIDKPYNFLSNIDQNNDNDEEQYEPLY